MSLTPKQVAEYHVFIASPSDMSAERQIVRSVLNEINHVLEGRYGIRLIPIDWENYATAGVGRAQALITQHTLERYKDSLVLLIGVIGSTFGSPTGTHSSGTQEEFEWARDSFQNSGYPEIKWFFKKIQEFKVPSVNPSDIRAALKQWEKVIEFRSKIARPTSTNPGMLYQEFIDTGDFRAKLTHDLTVWCNTPGRPWN